ncbi:MAG: Eco57I restriction-modification methylase domain-containing protein [Candidatus Absconditabacterales bacterium]|nr:Eco57I restriction-modification methylase domain-containing protein [Candidatus Absconditabacterales bacterium]
MNAKDLKTAIKTAIKNFLIKTVHEASIELFNILGYNTSRKNPLSQKTYDYFKESFIVEDKKFNEKKAIVADWKSIDLLFQLTKKEMEDCNDNFEEKQVDNTIIETYLFFSLDLKENDYNRSQLAQITREINKVFPMPVLIIFRYGENITLSVINRRLNRKDSQKDVLEKVTVIKDININEPHRAHIEILFDLSFSELYRIHKFKSFVELHNAWQTTLDTKELNKRFYRDLSNWYFWALQEVHFPTTNLEEDKTTVLGKVEKVKEHNAKNLIRLLTRLLFVWFIKEKNLVPEQLFDEKYIKDELLNSFESRKKKDFDYKTKGSEYYRAILQNLFFATLNQVVGERKFRNKGQNMNVTNLMRYESYFKNSQLFIDLVEKIVPFMNGGLFECLDAPNPVLKGKKGGDVIVYEDGFSDREDNSLCVPDYIFFGTGEHADLSGELGDNKQKDVTVNGLFNILKSYKFTITENTPIEEDIALDPELLGRVFENLLASYNPETKSTARKQTGSFYTPREIVNYMVDESLKAYLKQKLESEIGMKSEDAEVGLEFLLGYNEKENIFNAEETKVLINAIDNCKILDPACGSGAFPMGILHKLVHILHKLDPSNKLWKDRQIEKANAIGDSGIREKVIEDIETAFDNNELDYGRKLYLIENCIYGVDIQPIATQISKLRFFISLIVDQRTDKDKNNFGIRPLPNLETKFVSANTLIGIEKPDNNINIFDNPEIHELEKKLKEVRHRMFSAKTPKTKRKYRTEDQKIREEMSNLLGKKGLSNVSARQFAEWDPYNQNISSEWFDPEWMFGIAKGFDIAIGNPPYVDSESMVRNMPEFRELCNIKYTSARGNWDLFVLFVESGYMNTNLKGNVSFIIPNKIIAADYAKVIRNIMVENSISEIRDYSNVNVFKEAAVYPVTFISNKLKANTFVKMAVMSDIETVAWENDVRVEEFNKQDKWDVLFAENNETTKIINKMMSFPKLGDLAEVRGAATVSEAYEIKKLLTDSVEHSEEYFKFINTGTIDRYVSLWNERKTQYIKQAYYRPLIRKVDLNKKYPKRFYESSKEKIIIGGMNKILECFLDCGEYLAGKSTIIVLKKKIELKYIVGILNSKLLSKFYKIYFNSLSLSGGFYRIGRPEIKQLPIPFSDTQKRFQISKLVNKILIKKKADQSTNTLAIETEIDKIVYELYGLSNEEIMIIEEI